MCSQLDPMDIDTCYRLTVESRIRELWAYRQWFRTHSWADWPDIRKETEVELRCLVGVARRARAMAAAVERSNAAGDHFAYADAKRRWDRLVG